MISELTDEEILEFLMTSDLDENYRTQDFKYLILKFRSFYKIIYCNCQLYKSENELVIKNLNSTIESLNKEIIQHQIEKAKIQNELDTHLKVRKLSWRERLSGYVNK